MKQRFMPLIYAFTHAADMKRKSFVYKNYKCYGDQEVVVNRPTVYDDVTQFYREKLGVVDHFPIKVKFMNEDGLDAGGLRRDLFSAFWEQASYGKVFDGSALLVPISHAHVAFDQFLTLAKILSHGYLVGGFLPTRIAFPVLAYILKGPSVTIPQNIVLQSFCDYLCVVDRDSISQALKSTTFTDEVRNSIISVLSRYDCRDVPTPSNLSKLLFSIANHEFKIKPFAVLSLMNTGIPDGHRPFWDSVRVDELYALCSSLSASPQRVLEKIQEPIFKNTNERRVFNYLLQYVGEMKVEEVKKFLRYVTGSTVLIKENLTISFNALSGLARRPIAHTCSYILELSHTYPTYVEFEQEFSSILNNQYCWPIDSA